jgi:diguanylate cyclase (GGDEF)-like protein/PAS domain S-box-containing protein
LKILYVEDNPIDAALALQVLARVSPEYSVEVVTSLMEARTRLIDASDLDAVICDLALADGSGLALLGDIRARGLPLAVVILTGTGDQDTVSAALRAGADAYLIKHKQPLDMLPRILAHALANLRTGGAYRIRPLKVLYAEDNLADIELTRRHLAQHAPHIQLDAVHDIAGVLALLPQQAGVACGYDAVLLDYLLPDGNALEVVEVLRRQRGLDLPLLLVTGEGSEEVAARALTLGIDDYLVKHSGYLHKLPAAIESVCHRSELLHERASLQESEQRVRLLLDSTAEAIYGVDLDGCCTFVNAACLKLLGYQHADELVGRNIHELIHHSHADGTHYPGKDCRIYQAYLHDEEIHLDDEVFWHKDGHPVPVECWSYPMHRDGKVVGSVATFFDISARKHAEERLHLAALVFENTRDSLMITDSAGTILSVNRAFSEITGYSETEARGQRANLLHSGRHDAAFYQAMWTAINSAGFWQGEIWNRRKNGETYPEWLSINSVHDSWGAISHYVGVSTDLSQIKRSEAQLEHLAHHDPLTDLPNRAMLHIRLAHALERAKRHGQRIGVLHIDLDHFKNVNDSLGPAIGDVLLLDVVRRLGDRVRKEDILGRLGGDDFLLVLETIGESGEAAEIARDLLDLLATPFACGDAMNLAHEVFLGASIGISVFPDDSASFTELLRDAEIAMYRAKERGRNQFCFFTADMNADALVLLELEADLRRALERNELELHYQPKVDLRSGQIVGAEALLRWRRNHHSDGQARMTAPGQFIPMAEKTGLIVPIGAWVIDTACHQLRAWLDQGLSDVRLAVNVSACQLRVADFDRDLAETLQRHGVPAKHLELELTESMLMQDPDAATDLLKRLKVIGVKLSLDDFGTGYSSLAYLSRFPIDILKIDQSFVRDIVTDPDAAGIVSAVIGLAQRMNLRTIAEGVETEAQLGYLSKLGCEVMQGYYFSRPVPEAEFTTMLRDGKCLPVQEVAAQQERTLLLVDDETSILSALRRMLRSDGYRVLTAASAREGLEILARNDVQVILSDQRMPEMTGTEFLGRVKHLHPDTVRIVLSGYAELESIIEAVNQGAIYKFLIKPWDDDLLRGHIRDAFRYHDAVMKPRDNAYDENNHAR